ncbi:MAG: integrase core domain-containing protein [Chromatiaceae bacterium]|nr:integrase core domain-containing protein [Burkholderiaceae bacterium]MBP8290491.1 integrase core domain-containing protein [Chromatiaceae bacterium]MBP9604733.1 integrase core domain-containing protein [Chromatiaceae bacterium]
MEHRLTQPRTPPTNGKVERFNGRIAQVLATRRYHRAQDLEATWLRYVSGPGRIPATKQAPAADRS